MRPLLVAECGNNHDGNIDTAHRLICEAKEAGADIVKFQAGTAEGFTRDPCRYREYQKRELSKNEYDSLVRLAERLDIPVMFSVFPINSWRWEDYRAMENFKIAARQCSAENIFTYPARRLFVSIPHYVTDVSHIAAALTYLSYVPYVREVFPLHCVTEYPAKDPMLHRIAELSRLLKMPVGYSDHTIGITACKDAVDLGAPVIEKHFTLDHNQSGFRDHQLSATPGEMKDLANYMRGKR